MWDQKPSRGHAAPMQVAVPTGRSNSPFLLATLILMGFLLLFGIQDGIGRMRIPGSHGSSLPADAADAPGDERPATRTAAGQEEGAASGGAPVTSTPSTGKEGRLAPAADSPGAISIGGALASKRSRLMLATHNRLMWYNWVTQGIEVVHEAPVGGSHALSSSASCITCNMHGCMALRLHASLSGSMHAATSHTQQPMTH